MTKSIMRQNAEKDPSYCPYCLRCRGLVRMEKKAPFYWECKCGAIHDERLLSGGAAITDTAMTNILHKLKRNDMNLLPTPTYDGFYEYADGSRIWRVRDKWQARWSDQTFLRGDNDKVSWFDSPEEAAQALADGGEGPAAGHHEHQEKPPMTMTWKVNPPPHHNSVRVVNERDEEVALIPIALPGGNFAAKTHEEAEKFAALIATAPRLLAILETLAEKYRANEMVATWCEGTERHDVWAEALAAIAAAKKGAQP